MHEQVLLSSAEVCAQLDIDRSTVSRWVASGRLTPALKAPGIRGPFFFDEADINRLRLELEEAS